MGGGSAQLASSTALTPPATALQPNARTACDWILPAADVQAWLDRAVPGDRLTYGAGAQLVRGETATLLRQAQSKGDVHLFQPRSPGGIGFDFLAVKRTVTTAPEPRGWWARLADEDPLTLAIYDCLASAAERGDRCPADNDLARVAGLTVGQVKWRLKKLARAKRIATRTEWTPTDPRFRIVTIIDTARETAAPGRARA